MLVNLLILNKIRSIMIIISKKTLKKVQKYFAN